MALKPGSNESGSPADDDQVEVDARKGDENPLAERNAEVDAEPAPDPAPLADPAAEAGKGKGTEPPKPRKPSAVDLVIEQLTAPKPEDDETETPAAPPTGTATPKPKAGAAGTPEAPATGEGQPNVDDEEPLPVDQWPQDERKHTKGRTKQRYEKLYQAHIADQPLAEIGRGFRAMVAKHELDADVADLPDEAMAVAIRTQSAALRVSTAVRDKRPASEADVAWLKANRDALDKVLGTAGHAPARPAEQPEDLSKVEITSEVRDLKDAFGVLKDEDELRAVQATLNRLRAPKGKPAAKVAEQPPVALPPSAPAAPARTVPWTAADEQIAKAGMRRDLVAAGIPEKQLAGHMATNLTPLISKELAELMPGVNPDTAWVQISPSTRRELVKQAQSTWAAKAKPATTARTRAPTPPPVHTGTGTRAPLQASRPAVATGKGAVSATIAALCGGETE